jgi:hypothetical protein
MKSATRFGLIPLRFVSQRLRSKLKQGRDLREHFLQRRVERPVNFPGTPR